MMKYIFMFFCLFLPFFLSAQTLKRNANETAEQFVERIQPKYSGIVHPVIETNWNNSEKKVIIAFWNIEVTSDDGKYTGVYVDAKMLIPLGNNNYKQVTIDTIPENPTTPQILSVFFHDTDNDGKRELVLFYGWDYKHYMMAGKIYQATVYDDVNYERLPKRLTVIDEIDGGIRGNNDSGEDLYPNFTTAQELREILKVRKLATPSISDFNKSFKGVIGKNMDVTFSLKKQGQKISGFYYYEKRGIDIKLEGEIRGSSIELYELDYLGNKTAKINGKLGNNAIKGEWESISTKKAYSLTLKEVKSYVEPLPQSIVGTFDPPPSCKCDITVTIAKIKNDYTYSMKVGSKKYTGSVRFYRESDNSNSSTLYVEFEKFKWADYRGDLTGLESEEEFPPAIDTFGLDWLWDAEDKKLTLQNYGNAMNYYVKIDGCDEKYIELQKR